MNEHSRRDFLHYGSCGLAALGSGSLILRSDAQPTEGAGELEEYAEALKGFASMDPPKKWEPTEDEIEEPSRFRREAPFRAKVTPPGAPGKILLIGGRVWGVDTKKPLAHAVLDVWQANAYGRYHNEDPGKPPAKSVFLNRARLITDESGGYEFETIHPGPYKTAGAIWRPSHIHLMIKHPRYRFLTTQLYFRGDPHQDKDSLIKPSLIIDLKEQKAGGAVFKTGRFDIVLDRE
jgi:catechol 1,2-dioxygenase